MAGGLGTQAEKPTGLRVGVFFNARPDQGGLYQYAATLVHCLSQHASQHAYRVFSASGGLPVSEADPARFTVEVLPAGDVARRRLIELLVMSLGRLGLGARMRLIPPFGAMRQASFDLMLYVKPTAHSFLWSYRSVFPIHDLQHLLQPEFPEVASMGERARREFIYRHAIAAASGVLADSEVGRQDILKAYPIEVQKVHPLPYLAPTYSSTAVTEDDLTRVRSRYQLPDRFLFYPAAFWRHKNHELLLRAMASLQVGGSLDLALVLAGALRHEYPRVRQLVSDLSLEPRVRFLGYVPDEDIYPLYRLALGLAMPTFFGPSNIPVLEAWAQGCPVLTSDIRGIREQVGEAGLLADPRDPRAWAQAIRRLASDPQLRDNLVQRGRKRVASWTPQDFVQRLEAILQSSHAQSARLRS